MSKSEIKSIGEDIASMYGGELVKTIKRDNKYVFVIEEHGEVFETTPMTIEELETM